jgi:hypothetical protein
MEEWAETHRAVGMPIPAICRRLGVGRNTVRPALAAQAPPQYRRPVKGSIVDEVEPQTSGFAYGVADDAGDGDRVADRLGPVDHGAQGPDAGAAADIRAAGSGEAHRVRTG